jgi:hypothetical protein
LNDKTNTFFKRGALILAVFILYCALFAALINQESAAPMIPILAVAATTVTVFVVFRFAKKFNL